ncbi:MAG TPA: hypothetical protein VF375_08365, partial [Candidatus Limnocylindrales bacterium]
MSGRKMTGIGVVEDTPSERSGTGVSGTALGSRAEQSWRRDPLAWAMVLLGVCIALYTVWWISGIGNASLATTFTGAAAVPSGIVMALVAIRLRTTARVDPRTRRAWSIIAVGLILFG